MASILDRPTITQFAGPQGLQGSLGLEAADDAYPQLAAGGFQFRPFELADIGQLVPMAGEHRVADTTLGVPHPYTSEFARQWIASHGRDWEQRTSLHWAVLKAGESRLLGYAGLNAIDLGRRQGELRFWVGSGVKRTSYATAWAQTVLDFAINALDLKRVYALQLARHPPAARVLEAVGMRPEGFLRKRIQKEGLVEDVICWSILQDHWQALPGPDAVDEVSR
jgi:RimJ/RimL family protein N-acetyltransferase